MKYPVAVSRTERSSSELNIVPSHHSAPVLVELKTRSNLPISVVLRDSQPEWTAVVGADLTEKRIRLKMPELAGLARPHKTWLEETWSWH
jgi:hypothetical protein